jgi:hypothetical protein
MQIGYFAIGIGPTVDPEWVRTVVTTAERLGFSTVWAPEHVVLLDEYASKYPYSSGKFPAPTDTPIADPFATLAYAAACAVAKHAADVAHHDRRLWHCPRQRGHIGELRMVAPGVEHQPVRGETCHPGPDFGPPEKRPPPAWISASSTGSTRSPSARSAKPTMPCATLIGP